MKKCSFCADCAERIQDEAVKSGNTFGRPLAKGPESRIRERLSFRSVKQKTALLVMVGALLIPAAAFGARLASSWQSGSVQVKKIGPLQAVSWTPKDADYTVSEDSWPLYVSSWPLTLPSLPSSGAIASRLAIQVKVDIPASIVDSLRQGTVANGGEICIIGIDLLWGDKGKELVTLGGGTDHELDALLGSHVFTVVLDDSLGYYLDASDGDSWAKRLSSPARIQARIGCFPGLTLSFTEPGITITPLSLRVLAF